MPLIHHLPCHYQRMMKPISLQQRNTFFHLDWHVRADCLQVHNLLLNLCVLQSTDFILMLHTFVNQTYSFQKLIAYGHLAGNIPVSATPGKYLMCMFRWPTNRWRGSVTNDKGNRIYKLNKCLSVVIHNWWSLIALIMEA